MEAETAAVAVHQLRKLTPTTPASFAWIHKDADFYTTFRFEYRLSRTAAGLLRGTRTTGAVLKGEAAGRALSSLQASGLITTEREGNSLLIGNLKSWRNQVLSRRINIAKKSVR